MKAAIVGTGSAAPARVLTNADLEKRIETSDAWIVERTGIRARRIAGEGETAASLAEAASRRALEMAGADPASIDLVVAGTVTADHQFPSCASIVQGRLGAKNAFAFDVSAACAGSLYGLSISERYIQSSAARRALVIGVDVLSRITDWNDRGTCILFGDAAGAMLVEGTDDGRGILSTHLATDGTLTGILYAPPAGKIFMKGREVFKVAVRELESSARESLARAGVTVGEIQRVIAHQANLRILQAVVNRLGIPIEKCELNIDRYGNTSSASVPTTLDEANRGGRLQRGDLILIMAVGGGMAWGSMVVKW